MKPVLLDTGCIVALLDRSERNHQACADVIGALRAPLVTCEAVVAESCYLLRTLRGAPEAVLANIEQGVFQIPFRLDSAAGSLRELMRKYRRVPMDLADACLVLLAEQLQTGQILTLDGDFSIYRWNRRRRFVNLLEGSQL
jgi:predicted nucleic acid-binding protein